MSDIPSDIIKLSFEKALAELEEIKVSSDGKVSKKEIE